MIRKNEKSSLRWFAVLTALATLFLICVGGLVTSHGVGMAVPDWPNTYGYNMFFFPISQWIGGIFYEHTHRLVASGVGLMTMIMALWLHGTKSRPWLKWGGIVVSILGALVCFRYPNKWQDGIFMTFVGLVSFWASFRWPKGEPAEKWMRRLGLIAFVAVVLQGLLGGLRVTEMKDEIGIFHATLAQLFFVLICAIALFHTEFWRNLAAKNHKLQITNHGYLRNLIVGTALLIFLQLILGATMRHQHAGLAISDFPKAHGQWWPDTSQEAVARYNQARVETTSYKSITAAQIKLQMAHRLLALVILIVAVACAALTKWELGWQNPLSKISAGLMFLIFTQAFLGAATIWTNKSADVATAHVAIGALSLVTSAMLSMVAFRVLKPALQKCEVVNPVFAQPMISK